MTIRSLLLRTHRWLGLASAGVLVIAGLTGAILVWPGLAGRWIGALHDSLAIGRVGVWIVLVATAAAVPLQASGVWLWWGARTIRVRTGMGWRRFASDLHHSAGVLGLAVMLVIALTALGRVAGRVLDPTRQHEDLRRAVSRLHTTSGYPIAIKAIFTAGSLGFVIQGATGVAMWWRQRR